MWRLPDGAIKLTRHRLPPRERCAHRCRATIDERGDRPFGAGLGCRSRPSLGIHPGPPGAPSSTMGPSALRSGTCKSRWMLWARFGGGSEAIPSRRHGWIMVIRGADRALACGVGRAVIRGTTAQQAKHDRTGCRARGHPDIGFPAQQGDGGRDDARGSSATAWGANVRAGSILMSDRAGSGR